MGKKIKTFEVDSNGDDLEKIEEDIIKAADKAGKKNVIVNIITYPHKRLKQRWNVRYKFNKKHLVMDLLIAAGVLVLIGLNIFWLWGGFHYFSDNFQLEVSGPREALISGQETVFQVDYSNENKFPLQEVNLSFKYEGYFELLDVSAAGYDFNHNTLHLGDLGPGANGKILIKVRTFGSIGEDYNLVVNASFYKTDKKGERLWGQFSKTKFFRYNIGSSFLVLTTDTPAQMIKNQKIEITGEIANNNASTDYQQLSLRTSFAGKPLQQDDYTWQIDLDHEEKYSLAFGLAAETDRESADLTFELIWKSPNGQELLQAQKVYSIEIFDPKFEVKFSASGDGTITPGQSVEAMISYFNKGGHTIENVSFKLDLSDDYWDLKNIQMDNGRFEEQMIAWDFQEIPRLALIQPGESGEIKLSIGTREYVAGSQSRTLNSALSYGFKAEGQEAGFFAPTLGFQLNSNLSVQAYPMYYAKTGDQLGRGSIPPRVGKETKYWIFAKMINDINDVENVTVSATLPFNVSWNEKTNVPVGDPIKYDDATKTLTWQISKVPVNPENIGFAFEVGIIPTAGQKGTYPALLTDLTISGADKATGKLIRKDLGTVTTKLIYDSKGKLKDGVVK